MKLDGSTFEGKVISSKFDIYTFENTEGEKKRLQLGDKPKQYFSKLFKDTCPEYR